MDSKNTVANIFWESADKFPDNIALWVKGRQYSYEDLRQKSVAITSALSKYEGDLFGEHLAILGKKSLSSYSSILASLFLGMIYTPLSSRFPLERNVYMIQKVKAKGLVVSPECCDIAKDILAQFEQSIVVVFPENSNLPNWVSDFPQHQYFCSKDLVKNNNLLPSSRLTSQSSIYNLFTSGSTGTPKSVIVTNRNLLSYIKSIKKLMTITPEDKCTQLFDLTFDPSVHDMFICWDAGAALYSLPSQASSLAGRLVNELELTVWFSPPSTAAVLKAQNELTPKSFPSLRYSSFAGEALSWSLVKAWSEAACNSTLFNLYGPTEATVTIVGFQFEKGGNKVGTGEMTPIGWPFEDHSVTIVNEDLEPTGENEIGELCLAGPQVTQGYYDDPELTQQKFISLPHKNPDTIWYRTGDLARWDKTYGLLFHGRSDRQLKIRGFRVELPEIETRIKQIAKTELVGVVEIPAEEGKGYSGTVAFVGHSSLTENEIIEYCENHLPDYMVPEKIFFIDPFPTNVAGKTNYQELKSLLNEWKK